MKKGKMVSVLPTSQVFTLGYVNTETILHFFYKINNERGTKNRVYIRSCKMVLWLIRVRVLFELFYKYLYQVNLDCNHTMQNHTKLLLLLVFSKINLSVHVQAGYSPINA